MNTTQQFIEWADGLLECVYQAKVAKAPIMNGRSYRFIIPLLYDKIVNSRSLFTLETVEGEGLTYDWIMPNGDTVSLKSVKEGYLPRARKKGEGLTKPKPIQLKNTHKVNNISVGDFDYLLVISENPVSFALLSWKQVNTLLSESCKYNERCNEKGFDGSGQVKLYIPSKEVCLYHVEMSPDTEEVLSQKYAPIPSDDSNRIVTSGIDNMLDALADAVVR